MERVRKKGTARPEQVIQRAVFQHLAQRKAPGVVAFHVPNGGARRPIEARILKGLGVTPGIPDVFVIKPTIITNGEMSENVCRVYALELKPPDGKLHGDQAKMLKELEDAGAIVGVTYTLNEALRWLEGHGILTGKVS